MEIIRSNVANKNYSGFIRYVLAVAALHITGIALLMAGVHRYPQILGMAILSYTLGLRHAIPILATLSFPILFTAGMSLMDTADVFFMCTAYEWVFATPLRKVYYNLTITGLSVIAALFIGFIEMAQLLIPIF